MNQQYFHYSQNTLHVEDIPLPKLAQMYGTPLYIYSKAALVEAYHQYAQALTHENASLHYAVKANSNLAILHLFAKLGAGFDIVSKGELARVIAAGGKPSQTVFSGVGKKIDEIEMALELGIKCFNVESIAELERIHMVAQAHSCKAPISLRINPDIDAQTHPYISTGLKYNKFGIAYQDAIKAYQAAQRFNYLDIIGIDCHIGSQITSTQPYLDAIDKMLELIKQLNTQLDIELKHFDVGGGLGIVYQRETPPDVTLFVKTLLNQIRSTYHSPLEIIFEPGRSLTGNAGILLTQVEFLKTGKAKNFAIVDAAMNDLARPALYQAYHQISAVTQHTDIDKKLYDIVGPICESGDWLGQDRFLAIRQNDLLAIGSAGAYGFTMSSQYNSRPRAAEVMVDGNRSYLIRPRETVEALFATEAVLPL